MFRRKTGLVALWITLVAGWPLVLMGCEDSGEVEETAEETEEVIEEGVEETGEAIEEGVEETEETIEEAAEEMDSES